MKKLIIMVVAMMLLPAMSSCIGILDMPVSASAELRLSSPPRIVEDDEGYYIVSIVEEVYRSEEFLYLIPSLPIVRFQKEGTMWRYGFEGDLSVCEEYDIVMMKNNLGAITDILEEHCADEKNIIITYFMSMDEITIYFEDRVKDLEFHKKLLHLLTQEKYQERHWRKDENSI